MFKTIAGDYNLNQKLYAYGLRTTYRADNLKKSSTCAITLIPVRPGPSLNILKKRADLSKKLNHRHLITATDFGLASQEMFYYAHDFYEVSSIQETLSSLEEGEERFFGTLRFFLKFLEPVRFIHEAGLTHRDLQTSHFLVQKNDSPLLDGFINARPKTESKPLSNIVHLPYLAPEQLKGLSADVKTDIYALGVILFELLTGKLPYPSNFAKLEDAQEGFKAFEALKEAGLSDEPSYVIAKCLAPRKNRFGSVEELDASIEAIYKKRSLKAKWSDLTASWKGLFTTS